MADLQRDHRSVLGLQYGPALVAAVETSTAATARMKEAAARMKAWIARGAPRDQNYCLSRRISPRAGTMSNDWTADVVDLDLGQCFLTGSGAGVQAVRVDPQNGTVALISLRLTLHGAHW